MATQHFERITSEGKKKTVTFTITGGKKQFKNAATVLLMALIEASSHPSHSGST